jgi:Flp pilus assembly protein CpaB
LIRHWLKGAFVMANARLGYGIVLVALLLAGCAKGQPDLMAGHKKRSTASPPQPRVPVLVAKRAIPANALLKQADFFEIRMMPKDVAPQGAFDVFEKVKDRVLRQDLEAGKPLTENDLKKVEGRLILGPLPPGPPVLSIKVSREAGARLVYPGDRVDVELILPRRGGAGPPLVMTLVRDLEVLAVDDGCSPPDHCCELHCERVTVRVTREQAEELGVFEDSGNLRLVPRKAMGWPWRAGD